MEQAATQVLFFQHIKSLLPPHVSMVDDIAEKLDISTDSAYRRIRGEKPISIDELQKLASHYKISLDQLLHIRSNSFIFSGRLANASDHIFEKWLEETLSQVSYMNSFSRKHMYYLAKDIPIMQQFLVPELLAFKSFFWRKSILHYEELKGHKFSLKNIDPAHLDLGKKIAEVTCQIPSTDIWNIESINSTVRQIEFYREAGAFETPDDLNKLYESVFTLIDHLEKQAEVGLKFQVGQSPKPNAGAYNLFNNELILGDNTVMAELDDTRITFLNHSVINYITTADENFNNHMNDAIQNIIRKSTHMSQVGEKERTRFFNRIRDKISEAASL